MPYNTANFKQTDEWNRERLYYSPNSREQVTDAEFLKCIRQFGVGTVIAPEVCFYRIFELGQLCRSENVRFVTVPNIEICRKTELHKYCVFDRIISNNSLCLTTLAESNIPSVQTGFAFKPFPECISKERIDVLKFILIGGNNPFMRKNCHKILEAFDEIKEPGWELTITLHTDVDLYSDNENITIINRFMKYEEIVDLFLSNHVYCQLTTNEGLGLNKYESIINNLFLLTYDTEPYKDDLIHNKNSYLIPAKKVPMVDNIDAIIHGNTFEKHELISAVRYLIQNKHIVFDHVCADHRQEHMEMYSAFCSRFINAVFS